MAEARKTRLVAHLDCAGGGQVWVDGTTLYIGHMRHPHGTTIVDVADPANPRTLAEVAMPEGWHSHKVRVANGLMVVNHEQLGVHRAPAVLHVRVRERRRHDHRRIVARHVLRGARTA